ncbi:hypothetical protein OG562_13250 [Streptomyces sp. NBC_01275]|uniref:hypothetical protein n=1 Tax=Streptomyces sp. NBC_01275 TaxID=2903807 RepID=UPI0022551794|nr:hypothetical protein [Streptomyces sp. NBC_01275]MCX4761923.1 hypothetical protein [Streptomyces sp. NBC_01275]
MAHADTGSARHGPRGDAIKAWQTAVLRLSADADARWHRIAATALDPLKAFS